MIASVRENMQLRRAAQLKVRAQNGGAVAGYVHSSVQPPPTDRYLTIFACIFAALSC
jgi:translation elongation factor EF-Ts